MKALAVVPLYPPHSRVGAWLATHEFLAHLVDRGHEVTAVTMSSGVARPEALDGVRVVGAKTDVAALAAAADVVITHLDRGAEIAREAGKPCVQMAHGANMAAFDGVDLVVANSRAMADSITNARRVIVCHPHTRPEAHRVEATGDAVTLVNHSRAKGGKTFAQVAERLPDRRFLAVRGGYGEQVGLRGPNVVRWATQDDMRKVWAETRILVMPSEHETWGMVAVEAMLNGIPVIAHPTPGLRESLGDAGVFVDRDDIDGWVHAIAALDDPDIYQAASDRARARAGSIPDHRDLFATEIEALAAKSPTGLSSAAKTPRVAVVLPFRAGCPHRDAARSTVVRWWETITRGEWEIIEADDAGEPFSRGGSINTGIARTDADIIVAADADLLIGRQQIIDAVQLAASAPGLVQPFSELHWYDETATKMLLTAPHVPWTGHCPRPTYRWDADMPGTPLRGGLNVFSRQTWERAGGFLPTFAGWGHEDLAFWAQCSTLVAPPRRITGPAHHCYHPKPIGTPYASAETIDANAAAWRQIQAADGDPAAMRAAVIAAGGRL